MSICRKCGNLLPDHAVVCPYCGTPAAAPQNMPMPPAAPLYAAPQGMPPQSSAPQPSSAAYPPVCPAEPDGGLSTAQYFWMLIIFMLPVIGIVFMFYWAFGQDVAPARRRLSRAFLIKTAVALGLLLVSIALWAAVMISTFHLMQNGTGLSSSFGSYTAALVLPLRFYALFLF